MDGTARVVAVQRLAVPVAVCIVAPAATLVETAVAVVVDSVTALFCRSRVDGTVRVVAVLRCAIPVTIFIHAQAHAGVRQPVKEGFCAGISTWTVRILEAHLAALGIPLDAVTDQPIRTLERIRSAHVTRAGELQPARGKAVRVSAESRIARIPFLASSTRQGAIGGRKAAVHLLQAFAVSAVLKLVIRHVTARCVEALEKGVERVSGVLGREDVACDNAVLAFASRGTVVELLAVENRTEGVVAHAIGGARLTAGAPRDLFLAGRGRGGLAQPVDNVIHAGVHRKACARRIGHAHAGVHSHHASPRALRQGRPPAILPAGPGTIVVGREVALGYLPHRELRVPLDADSSAVHSAARSVPVEPDFVLGRRELVDLQWLRDRGGNLLNQVHKAEIVIVQSRLGIVLGMFDEGVGFEQQAVFGVRPGRRCCILAHEEPSSEGRHRTIRTRLQTVRCGQDPLVTDQRPCAEAAYVACPRVDQNEGADGRIVLRGLSPNHRLQESLPWDVWRRVSIARHRHGQKESEQAANYPGEHGLLHQQWDSSLKRQPRTSLRWQPPPVAHHETAQAPAAGVARRNRPMTGGQRP